MKLFNINLNLNINSTKNILKFLLLAFIIILCIYILYISSLSTIEAFSESKDCSNCQIMPSSGNCVKFYDFSYSFYDNLQVEDIGISFETIDTSYIFCPYEPKCQGNDFIMTSEERQNLSNDDILLGKGSYNINCCSGEWLEDNVLSYKDVYENINDRTYTEFTGDSISTKCSQFKNDFLSKFTENGSNILEFNNNYELLNSENLTEANKNKLNIALRNNNYSQIVTFCRTHDKNHPTYSTYIENKDFSGMLFKRDISSSGHILADPKLLPKSSDTSDRIQSVQELLDAQKMLSLPMERKEIEYTVFENGIQIPKTRFETGVSGEILKQINDLNDQLKNLNPMRNDFNVKFQEIQNDLSDIYVDSCGNPLIEYINYNYTPYKNKQNSNNDVELQEISPPSTANVQSYILNEDEFMNCFGDVNDNKDMSFNNNDFSGNLFSLGRENAFGVSEDANYSTQQDLQSNQYGNIIDLSAEFRHLENVDIGGTAPTGVIDQYLRAINGFYEKQMANMLGPKTHAINQQLVFENDGLETKESTFFVYENKPNNEYECQPSITGNDKFKDCGPSAYYSEFKT